MFNFGVTQVFAVIFYWPVYMPTIFANWDINFYCWNGNYLLVVWVNHILTFASLHLVHLITSKSSVISTSSWKTKHLQAEIVLTDRNAQSAAALAPGTMQ